MLDEFQLCLYDQSTKGVKHITTLNKNANYCEFCPLEYWAGQSRKQIMLSSILPKNELWEN